MNLPPIQLGKGRWLVPTSCNDCFVRVGALRLDQHDFGAIDVSLMTSHGRDYLSLAERLRQAWRVLRGQGTNFFELYSADEVSALRSALAQASDYAFPPNPLVGQQLATPRAEKAKSDAG